MKKSITAVGIFPRTSEVMFVSFPKETQPYYIVATNSREEAWIKRFINKKFILSYQIDEKYGYHSKQTLLTILKYSNLLKLLRGKKIEYLLVTIAKDYEREQWAKKNGITLLYTEYDKQVLYENKIWFDKFLSIHNLPKPQSFLYTYNKHKLKIPFTGKVVIQKADSLGNDGTYILNSIKDISFYLAEKILKPDETYLLREFIHGKTYGIELFISSATIAISLARMQCFYKHETIPNFVFFNGTQFLPSSFFSVKLKKKLTQILLKVGNLLYHNTYLGYAGIDIIIDQSENIYILECNPRFTTSSPHLLHYPEIFSYINSGELFITNFLKRVPYRTPVSYGYPEIAFSGSVLRLLLSPHSKKKKIKISKEYPIGLYSYKNGAITFVDPDIRNMGKSDKEFTYYCDLKKGELYKPNTYIADIFANFSLYTQEGKLNKDAHTILIYFSL